MELKNERKILAIMLIAYILLITFTVVYVRMEMDRLETALRAVEMVEEVVPEPVVMEVKEVAEDVLESLPKAVETIPEEPELVEEYTYYDVPLEKDLQRHIFIVCESYGVDPELVMGIIQRESCYTADAIGDGGNSLGLMQIQPRWHQARMEKLGVTDLLDPYQNVLVGVDLLAELYSMNSSTEWVLMAYNGGCGYANRKLANGEISDYAVAVLGNREEMTVVY